MPYNSSDEFDIINLVEFDTFQTPQPQNKTQNHLHGGHLVPPDPWEKTESQRGPSGAGRTPGSVDPTWQLKSVKDDYDTLRHSLGVKIERLEKRVKKGNH